MAVQHQSGATAQVLGALRDIFWHALPGGLFLGIGIVSGKLNLERVSEMFGPYHPPKWAATLFLAGGCYLAGHVLAAIAFLRADLWTLFHLNDPDWLAEYPREVNARDLYLRHYFPEIFGEVDRRQRVATLLWSSAAALLIGWLVFYIFHPGFADVVIWTAILVFLDAVTVTSYLSRARKAIHAAGLAIEEHEKAVRESENAIHATGDELRFIIDAIFRAVELAKPRESQIPPSAKPSLQPPLETPESAGVAAAASTNPNSSSPEATDI